MMEGLALNNNGGGRRGEGKKQHKEEDVISLSWGRIRSGRETTLPLNSLNTVRRSASCTTHECPQWQLHQRIHSLAHQ